MADTAAASGRLHMPDRALERLCRQRHFDPDLFPCGIQFIRDNHRNTRVGALAEICLPHPDCDRIV